MQTLPERSWKQAKTTGDFAEANRNLEKEKRESSILMAKMNADLVEAERVAKVAKAKLEEADLKNISLQKDQVSLGQEGRPGVPSAPVKESLAKKQKH